MSDSPSIKDDIERQLDERETDLTNDGLDPIPPIFLGEEEKAQLEEELADEAPSLTPEEKFNCDIVVDPNAGRGTILPRDVERFSGDELFQREPLVHHLEQVVEVDVRREDDADQILVTLPFEIRGIDIDLDREVLDEHDIDPSVAERSERYDEGEKVSRWTVAQLQAATGDSAGMSRDEIIAMQKEQARQAAIVEASDAVESTVEYPLSEPIEDDGQAERPLEYGTRTLRLGRVYFGSEETLDETI